MEFIIIIRLKENVKSVSLDKLPQKTKVKPPQTQKKNLCLHLVHTCCFFCFDEELFYWCSSETLGFSGIWVTLRMCQIFELSITLSFLFHAAHVHFFTQRSVPAPTGAKWWCMYSQTFPSYLLCRSCNKFLLFIHHRFSILFCVSLLKYHRITSLEILVKRNKHVAVPGANSFSVIHGYRLHGGLFMNRITSVFCWSETLIISLWSCIHSVLVSLIVRQNTVHRTCFLYIVFQDLCCLSCLNLQ